MSSLLRKYQQPLMIIITVLVIIAFVIYWNGNQGARNSRMPTTVKYVGKVYGNSVTKDSYDRDYRMALVALELRLTDLLDSLAGKRATEDEGLYNFSWNYMVLSHEADRLQIKPLNNEIETDDEVKTAIMSLPAFQTPDGQFDSAAYTLFVNNRLPHYGFTSSDLDELVAENLRLKKIKALLQTTYILSEDEFLAQYTLEYQKIHASVIHFNVEDFAAKIQVSDDDIKKEFEQHTDMYRSPEKRGIKYVTFSLTDEEKKLTDEERNNALQKLATAAQDFTQAMLEKGAKFDDVAAKNHLSVTVVPPFAPSEADPKLIPTPGLIMAAFTTTEKQPNSDVVQGENGFYVVQLQQIVPSEQLNLADARPLIIKQIKMQRAKESLSTKAGDARSSILADLHAGKSFEDATKAAGMKAEAYPAFSYAEQDLDKPDAAQVMYISLQLKEGEISPFVPTEEGGILVRIDKRDPIDKLKFQKDRIVLHPRFAADKLYLVFREWLEVQRKASGAPASDALEKKQPAPAQ